MWEEVATDVSEHERVEQLAVACSALAVCATTSAEFVRLNPMGEVPALSLGDGSTVLTESLVICRYLEVVRTGGAGSPLYGENPVERAETDMWYARAETK